MARKPDPQVGTVAVEYEEILVIPGEATGPEQAGSSRSSERSASHDRRRDQHFEEDRGGSGRALIGLGLAAATAGAAFFFARKMGEQREPDYGNGRILSDAPHHVLRGKAKEASRNTNSEQPLVGRTVTINRPRQELYQRWRDFTRFPEFMDNVREVVTLDEKRSRWTIEAPMGATVQVITRIVEEIPGETIAWISEPDSQIETDGRVEFADAPPGRGTYVRLLIRYKPPAGTLGQVLAKVMQREPNVQARRDLRRFKQLMETGEVVSNASPSGREADNPPTETRV